jgi:hypothetical protein
MFEYDVPLSSEAENVRKAAYLRTDAIKKEEPGLAVRLVFQDTEPRATLHVERNRELVRREFVESVYTPDVPSFNEEYIASLKECGQIVIHLPRMNFDEEYITAKVVEVWKMVADRGLESTVVINGFLYDIRGKGKQVL